MAVSDQIALANVFRKMHQSPQALLLPNAWDAVSARLFEETGFRAVERRAVDWLGLRLSRWGGNAMG